MESRRVCTGSLKELETNAPKAMARLEPLSPRSLGEGTFLSSFPFYSTQNARLLVDVIHVLNLVFPPPFAAKYPQALSVLNKCARWFFFKVKLTYHS